jgi:hypothetical protein
VYQRLSEVDQLTCRKTLIFGSPPKTNRYMDEMDRLTEVSGIDISGGAC